MARRSTKLSAIAIFGQPLRPGEAAEQVAYSTGHLAKLRRDGKLLRGIHYDSASPRTVRYYADSLMHYCMHLSEPAAHKRWIQQRVSKQR
jgi:hypothetical protein